MRKRYQKKGLKKHKTLNDYFRELGGAYVADANRIQNEYHDLVDRWGRSAANAIWTEFCINGERWTPFDQAADARHRRNKLLRRLLMPPPGRTIHSLAKEIEQKSRGRTSFDTAKDQIRDALEHAKREQADGTLCYLGLLQTQVDLGRLWAVHSDEAPQFPIQDRFLFLIGGGFHFILPPRGQNLVFLAVYSDRVSAHQSPNINTEVAHEGAQANRHAAPKAHHLQHQRSL
jgi:hypothetical protein